MLHYYAVKFFAKVLVSAYIDRKNLTLDYIDDDLQCWPPLPPDVSTAKLNCVNAHSCQLGTSDVITMRHSNSHHGDGLQDIVPLKISCFPYNSLVPGAVWEVSFPKVRADPVSTLKYMFIFVI